LNLATIVSSVGRGELVVVPFDEGLGFRRDGDVVDYLLDHGVDVE
jgi:hypothetical protein